jgi:hypothetical protein
MPEVTPGMARFYEHCPVCNKPAVFDPEQEFPEDVHAVHVECYEQLFGTGE